MINKRLISTVGESKKYIAGNVACRRFSLAASITTLLAKLFYQNALARDFAVTPGAPPQWRYAEYAR